MMVLGQYRAVLFGIWWYWVSIGWYWMVLSGTGSVKGGPVRYLVVPCLYGTVMVSTWWCWVSITWYCLVISVTGLVMGLYACILKKWNFNWLSLFREKRQTRKDRATQPMDHDRLKWAKGFFSSMRSIFFLLIWDVSSFLAHLEISFALILLPGVVQFIWTDGVKASCSCRYYVCNHPISPNTRHTKLVHLLCPQITIITISSEAQFRKATVLRW